MIKITSRRFRIASLCCLALVSCTDNGIDGFQSDAYTESRAAKEVDTPGGLVQQPDGTWKTQNCRVPIVGPGRVVNEINNSTINVIGVGQGSLENIVDQDLTNSCVVPVTVNAGVGYTPIVSVKDMYHVYSAGQKVGFVYKDTEGGGAQLLDLSLIQGMTLETYLNGKQQQTVYAADETSTLKLDLVSFNTGGQIEDRVLAFLADKPFDEVRMNFTGVDATVASNIALAIKYAFVGENPEIRATAEPEFDYYWGANKPLIHDTGIEAGTFTNVANANYIVDADTSNSVPFTVALGIPSITTVRFRRTIPVGTEVGYCYSGVNVLGLGLFAQSSPTLISYDDNNKELERSTPSQSLLGVSVIGVTGKNLTNMILKKECTQLKFQHPSELLKVGGMSVYYAYIREGVKLDPVNYFTFGDDVTYDYSYSLPKVNEGKVEYIILSQPYGANAEIKNGKLTELTKDGNYRVQAFYIAPDGRQVSHIANIKHISVENPSGCNSYITAASHGAYATEAIGTTACLLCLFNGTNDLNNAVDNDPDNYAVVGEVAGVLQWNAVAAFKMNRKVEIAGEKTRTGFVIQANSYLLDLNALSLFTIKLYDGETLVSEHTADDKASVNLGLLGFDQSKMRLSVETDKPFDRIELWRKGVADVATSIRIYNLFYEPASCEEAIGGGGCMEVMTNIKDNLQIDYPHTAIGQGVLSIASTVTNLDYILDGNIDTGASTGALLGISGSVIGLKFNKKTAHQSVGLIFSGFPSGINLNVANVGVITVYNGDKKVASNADVDILGVSVISDGGYTYIEVMVDEEFDRLTYTSAGIQGFDGTKICGVYYRPDSDGDGIPDCADTDDASGWTVDDNDCHTCYGNPLNIPFTKVGTEKNICVYAYSRETGENIRCNGSISANQVTIPSKALPVGRYILYIYADEKLIAYDVNAVIHPQTATWKTTPKSTDWNDWDNWKDGSPWKCTDVILPSNAATYPELLSTVNNYCRNIHFEPGAEIVGTQYLSMSGKVFVDVALQGGRYYLMSAPLKEMVTGDMFISPDSKWGADKYFTVLTADNYKESRNKPIVYQHFWNSVAMETFLDKEDEDFGKAEWSDDFNAVATHYASGQGFLMRAGASTDRNVYTFSFPKEHSSYTYFNSVGVTTGKAETVNRVTASIGEFTMKSPGSVTIKNTTPGKVFLMGNPTMSHIDIDKFLEANTSVSEVRVCKGRYYDKEATVESQTLSSKDNSSLLVAPVSAFFVIVNGETSSLTVNLTDDMLTQKHTLKN